MKSGEEYRENLRALNPSVYMRGEKVEEVWEDSRLQSTVNLVSSHHDISFDPNLKNLT